MNVCVLVLAAGLARRFGSDKRLATLADGRRVIDAHLDQISSCGLPLLVGIRDGDTELAAVLGQRSIPFHHCAHADEGMGATLAEAVAQLNAFDGVLISLADMPWIKPTTYSAVACALTTATICVPYHAKLPGHPVGFGKDFFGELAALAGGSGARSLLTRHPDAVRELHVDDAGIHHDVDTPLDLRRQNNQTMNTHMENQTQCK